jgi:outer membrane biosynthesis protein TonB
MGADLAKWSAAKGTVPLSQSNTPIRNPARPVQLKSSGGGGGAGVMIVIICVIAAAGFFIWQSTREKKPQPVAIVDSPDWTQQVVAPDPVAEPLPPVQPEPNPLPIPEQPEVVVRQEPDPTPPVVEPEPEEKPERPENLPPGDPELRTRAIGLIEESRKVRDKALADNASSLRFDIAAQARSADPDEVEQFRELEREISGDRVPLIEGAEAYGVRLASAISLASEKEESIDASYRSDLTRIRDSYVTRLETSAETSDGEIKQRLLAQAKEAADLDEWIELLSPETKVVRKSFSGGNFGGTFIGKWTVNDGRDNRQWIAHPDGRLEVVGKPWEVTWVVMEDASVEVRFEGKKPYKYNRDGGGWTGKSPFGAPLSLTRGDW